MKPGQGSQQPARDPRGGARRGSAPSSSANGAVPFQPGATPQESATTKTLGLKARAIVPQRELAPTALDRAFSAHEGLAHGSWGGAPGWYGNAPLALPTGALPATITFLPLETIAPVLSTTH